MLANVVGILVSMLANAVSMLTLARLANVGKLANIVAMLANFTTVFMAQLVWVQA